MKVLCLVFLSFLTGCASGDLAPVNQRSAEFQFETNLSKGEGFNKGIQFFSKKFSNFSKVVQSQDKEEGVAVMKGNTSCNVLRQAGDINDYSLSFTLTFLTKEKKTRLQFEDLVMTSSTGEPVGWAYNQLVDEEKIAKAKGCLSGLSEGLKAALNDKSVVW